MANYSVVYIFTKRTNLKSFLDTHKVIGSCTSQTHVDVMRRHYEAEREVQLICMFRWETNGPKGTKCFCKIKCPINPLPIKGEFETPGTTTPVVDFLKADGWEFKQKLYPKMFE